MLIDVNVLVLATATELPAHAAVKAWWENVLATEPRIALPWATTLGFIRIVSNTKWRTPALPVREAWQLAAEWLDRPNVVVPEPTEDYASRLGAFLNLPEMRAEHVPDAHLAALAVVNGLVLVSRDRGFGRYPALIWRDPIVAPASIA
ncbi:MAG: PIN domain-containing protein [Myxococcales bacterium]|nr:PIN domain-containing protein [Myxococcales bacterium]